MRTYAALPPSYTDWVHIGTGTDLRRCLEINNNNKVAGQPVQQWECVGVAAQEWKTNLVAKDTTGERSWHACRRERCIVEESGACEIGQTYVLL